MSDEEVIEVTVDLAELKKMKVADLKRKLSELGLEAKGTKAELIARVEKYLSEQEEDEDLLEEEEEEEESEEVIDELVDVVPEAQNSGDQPTDVLEGGGGEEQEKPTERDAESGEVVSVEGGEPGTQSTAGEKEVTKVSLSGLSGAERLARRAERFGGNTSIEAKKMARAERFGTSLENGVYTGLGKRPLSSEEMERMRKRGERFGTTVSPAIAKVDDDERKKKRIEKFGLTATELSEEERKKKRAEKFGT